MSTATMPTKPMADVLEKLAPAGRYLSPSAQGFRLYGGRIPAGVLRDVKGAKVVDALIERGYIGRTDQRAMYYITERGKIMLAEYREAQGG